MIKLINNLFLASLKYLIISLFIFLINGIIAVYGNIGVLIGLIIWHSCSIILMCNYLKEVGKLYNKEMNIKHFNMFLIVLSISVFTLEFVGSIRIFYQWRKETFIIFIIMFIISMALISKKKEIKNFLITSFGFAVAFLITTVVTIKILEEVLKFGNFMWSVIGGNLFYPISIIIIIQGIMIMALASTVIYFIAIYVLNKVLAK